MGVTVPAAAPAPAPVPPPVVVAAAGGRRLRLAGGDPFAALTAEAPLAAPGPLRICGPDR